jgi:phage shock protein A
MSMFQRIKTIFGAKADKALDRMEDPNQTLDYSYKKQLELLQKVRRGVADVSSSSSPSCRVRRRRHWTSIARTWPARP